MDDARIETVMAGFVIEERISSSPLAAVYRARRGDLKVALKVCAPQLQGEKLDERARRERETMRKIVHPAVARLVDEGNLPDGSSFFASQWIAGVTLENRLARGPMAWDELEPIVAALGRGLGAIHAAGVIHRDLKPSNIMLPASGDPCAVILDFGHSLVLSEERLTDQGLILGSASYMAPEQAAGQPLDGRADLYTLGVIVYRALTGELPFANVSAAEVLRCHQWEPVMPPRSRTPDYNISPTAEDLCMWLLAKDPALRLPNARVLAVTLGALAPQSSHQTLNGVHA